MRDKNTARYRAVSISAVRKAVMVLNNECRIDVDAATTAVERYVLQIDKYHTVRNNLLKAGCPGKEAEMFLMNVRENCDIMDWKLEALPMHRKEAPTVFYALSVAAREAQLQISINDVMPVIKKLSGTSVAFLRSLYHMDVDQILKTHAVVTFRWMYPFAENPSALLNTALHNHARNMARDSSTKGRGLRQADSDGGFAYRSVSLDQLPTNSLEMLEAANGMTVSPAGDFNVLVFQLGKTPEARAVLRHAVATGSVCADTIAKKYGIPYAKVVDAVKRIGNTISEHDFISPSRIANFL